MTGFLNRMPATLTPDLQGKSPKPAMFQGVADKFEITDGKQTIHVYANDGDTHTNEYTLFYLPGPRILVEGDAYALTGVPELPGSLESALRAFGDDPVVRNALGPGFCDYYATSRRWELKAWRDTVTDWERERYERAV